MAAPQFTGFVLDDDEPRPQLKSRFVLDPTPLPEVVAPPTPEPVETVDETPVETPPVEDKGFWTQLFENVGSAAATQARIGEVQSPEQLEAVTDFGKEIASAASFGLTERIPGMKPPDESDTKYVAELIGMMAPISLYNRWIAAPLVGLVKNAGKAGKYIAPFVRMTSWGGFGMAKAEATALAKGEELPTAKELVIEGGKWAIADGILQGAELGVEFAKAINNIAKETGATRTETLGRFFNALKNKAYDMFTNPPTAEVMLETVKQLENQVVPKPPTTIDVTPPKPPLKTPAVIVPPERPSSPPPAAVKPVTKPKGVVTPVEPKKPVEKPSPPVKPAPPSPKEEAPSVPSQVVPTTAKKLKEQKEYLLDAARDALEEAKDVAPKDEPYITIKVPDDGTFQVINTKKAIAEFIKRAKKTWPTTVGEKPKIKKPRAPAGRVGGPDVEYYNEFKPRKAQPKSTDEWGYDGTYYTDGKIAIKTDKPPRKLVKARVIPKEKISAGMQSIYGQKTKPAKIEAEFNHPKFEYPLVHVSSKGKDWAYRADYVDQILTKYPKSEIEITEPGALVFVDKGEFVGAIMPIEAGGGLAGESRTKFTPIKKRGKPAKVKKTTFDLEEPKKHEFPRPEKAQFLEPKTEGKGEAGKRSDIIRLFADKFKIPLRKGKIRQRRAAGIYKPDYKAIRLKDANNIETAAHEIGHDLSYKIWETAAGIRKALAPYMDELMPISRYDPHEEEGFAEFTRMYVTRPESAKALAPKFYKFFEATLNAIDPTFVETLQDARALYARYLEGSPKGRVEAQIDFQRFRTRGQKFVDKLERKFNLNKLKTEWLDDIYEIKAATAEAMGMKPVEVEQWKASMNVYRAARLLKGWAGKAEVFLDHETFDFRTLKPVGKSLKEILKPIKTNADMRDFSTYLVARRATEKIRQGFKTGIRLEDAEVVVKELERFEPIAQELDKYMDDLLKYVRDSGLLSQEAYLKIKKMNKLYVPWARVLDEEMRDIWGRPKRKAPEPRKTGVGVGRLQAAQVIKRFRGDTSDIVDPLETIVANTYYFIKMAERNMVGRKLGGLARIAPNSMGVERIPPRMAVTKVTGKEIVAAMKKNVKGMVPPEMLEGLEVLVPDTLNVFRPSAWSPKENVITVWVAGKPQYYELPKALAEAWKRGMDRYVSHPLVKILSIPARILRAGAILNPRFLKKNFVRDTLERLVFHKSSAKDMAKNVMQPVGGLFSSVGKSRLYIDFLKAGGGMATLQSIDKVFALQRNSAVVRGMSKFKPITLLRRAGEISEEANRLAEFASVLANEPKNRLGMEIAAYAARDISIDFAKMGMLVRAINQMIPFWNVRLQGIDKLVRTLAAGNKEEIRNFLIRAILGISIPTLLIKAAMRDDEDLKEVDDVTRDSNWMFRIPGKTEITQIPVPFETGMLFHGTMARGFDYLVEKDPNAFDGYFGSLLEGAMPDFIPAFAKPPIEVYANKDFWRQKPIVPPSTMGLISEEQYSAYTSETAKKIAQVMRYMPKVDAYESWLTSPAIVEHFITSWGAGLGSILLKTSDALLRAAGVEPEFVRPEESIGERYGLDAFTKRFPNAGSKSITEFYDNYNLFKKIEASAKAKAERGDQEGYKRLRREFGKINLHRYYDGMRRQQQAINNIIRNPNISPKDKREQRDKLYLNMIKYAQHMNKQIEKHRSKLAAKK